MSNEDIKEKYNDLINKEIYKEFIENNSDYYLSHMFFVYEKKNLTDEQIGFYSPKADKVVSFDLVNHKVSEPEDAMKKSGKIPGFKISDVNVGFSEVFNKAKKLMNEKYSQHFPKKYICILQVLNDVLVWNLTIVTNTLHMVNVRIDASSGKILEDEARSLMSLSEN
jgi:hypothetical protein